MPVTDNMVESYFSEEIVTKFRSSEYFTHNSSANMKIRVNSSLEEVKWPVISLIGSIGTLGLFPSITRTYGRIQFEIYDSKNSKSIKTFKYRVQHRQFLGTSIIIIGAFFPLMSDRFDHSLNARNFAIMRVGFQQFENDLLKELEENKSLLKNFTKDPDKVYALLPFGNKMSQDNSYENQIYTGLESQFIKSGLSIVERKKIQSLLSEIRFSNSGLTTSNRLAFGKFSNAERLIIVSDLDINEPEKKSRTEINFSIRCVEIESGKIIWSRRLSYSNSDQKSMGIHIGLSVRKLINELMTNGEI
ncbi:MAG: hypothetical protein JJT78_14615 [Leptospira sp.]|nr:hypothetical protein [Leptospira sp.]